MKLQKGNVFTPVCQLISSQGGGGVLSLADPCRQTLHHPQADNPSGQTPTPGKTPIPGQTPISPADTTAEMATAADSTHHTGIHSCLIT